MNKLEGVKEATVNLTNETATVIIYPDVISEEKVIVKIQGIGYDAQIRENKIGAGAKKEKELKKKEITLIISAILSLPLLVTMLDHLLGITVPSILMNPWFQFALATPVQFIIGWQFYVSSYKNLKIKKPLLVIVLKQSLMIKKY